MHRIAIEALNASAEEVFRLREMLGHGGIAAVPTETFYGLAADPWNEKGVRRIYRVKGRDDGKPLLALFSRRSDLDRLGVDAPAAVLERYLRIWPAPLTVVFRIGQPIPASRGHSTLAVRLPTHAGLRALLEKTGPLTGTSVNRSGSRPLDDADAVEALFGRDLDVLVDGGKTPGGEASTVIDATRDPPVVLRAGAFPWPAS